MYFTISLFCAVYFVTHRHSNIITGHGLHSIELQTQARTVFPIKIGQFGPFRFSKNWVGSGYFGSDQIGSDPVGSGLVEPDQIGITKIVSNFFIIGYFTLCS